LTSLFTPEFVKQTALDCGFDVAGIASAAPAGDYARYQEWIAAGMAGEMAYLTDHRGRVRANPQELLPAAKTVLCVGKVYNTPYPYSTEVHEPTRAWISRYAWGRDYHDSMRKALTRVVERLRQAAAAPFESRICVDTAPLLERSYARLAGLGWIGRNTCLINQQLGSWLFLGELLLSLDLMPDMPAPDRCGTCRRCIDACPTQALVPKADGTWALDAPLCISYFTIEKRGAIPAEQHSAIGHHVFGCDICQDVCPWNRKTAEPSLQEDAAGQGMFFSPELADLADMTEDDFRRIFRETPVWRAKYSGFLRNVAIGMGNSRRQEFLEPLERLSQHSDAIVAGAAQTAHARLRELPGIR
jgi:epoxyqueuosine reductase